MITYSYVVKLKKTQQQNWIAAVKEKGCGGGNE